MKHSLLFIWSLVLLVSCKPGVPSEYIQPGDMEDILYDYHLAQAMARNEGTGGQADFNKTVYFQAVLKKHGVTQAEFDSTLVWYYSHVDRLRKIYTEVNERLADDAKTLGASVGDISRYSQYSATGDTANIWTMATEMMLVPRPTMNRYDFTIKADTAFHKGDSFMFQFMADYLWQSGGKDVTVCIVSKYEGDSIIQTCNHVNMSGIAQIRIPANHENRLKEMQGFIYLSGMGDQSDSRKLMFVSQIQLIRFHNKNIITPITNDSTRTDSIKADSLKRIDNPGRPVPDTLRRRDIGGLRGKSVPAPTRTPFHRVDARPIDPKR